MAIVKGATKALLLALAGCGLLAAMSPVSEAAQRPGGRYDGRLPGDLRLNFRVSQDGARLAGSELPLRMRCNDGRGLAVDVAPEPGAPVLRSGLFGFGGTHSYTTRRGGRNVSGTLGITVSGTFSPSGESAAGRIGSTFTSPTLRCSNPGAPFTVYLDGTRGAPFRTARVATGRYRMRVRGRGLRIRGPLRAFAPAGEVTSLSMRSRVPCRGGGSFTGNDRFERLPLKRGVASQRRRFRVRRGNVVSLVRSRLVLRFYKRGAYRVRGTWRVSARVFRGGRRDDTCLLTKRLTGRFRSGPKNLF